MLTANLKFKYTVTSKLNRFIEENKNRFTKSEMDAAIRGHVNNFLTARNKDSKTVYLPMFKIEIGLSKVQDNVALVELLNKK